MKVALRHTYIIFVDRFANFNARQNNRPSSPGGWGLGTPLRNGGLCRCHVLWHVPPSVHMLACTEPLPPSTYITDYSCSIHCVIFVPRLGYSPQTQAYPLFWSLKVRILKEIAAVLRAGKPSAKQISRFARRNLASTLPLCFLHLSAVGKTWLKVVIHTHEVKSGAWKHFRSGKYGFPAD